MMHVTCHLQLHTTPEGLAWLIANANAAGTTPDDYISMLFNDAHSDAMATAAALRENFTSHLPSNAHSTGNDASALSGPSA